VMEWQIDIECRNDAEADGRKARTRGRPYARMWSGVGRERGLECVFISH
jgi:hypothetical protein